MTVTTMTQSLVRALTRNGWGRVDARATSADLVLTWGADHPPRVTLVLRDASVTLVELDANDDTLLTRWEQITPDNLARVHAYIDSTTRELT